MTIPLDYGLSGFVWDQNGNRSVVSGLINPFWICVNMLLRAMGLTAGLEAPLNTQTITITLPPSSFFSFSGSTIGDFKIVAFTGNPIGMWACLIAWIGSAFTGNAYSVPMSNAANQAEVLLAAESLQLAKPRSPIPDRRESNYLRGQLHDRLAGVRAGVRRDRRTEPDRQRREGADRIRRGPDDSRHDVDGRQHDLYGRW